MNPTARGATSRRPRVSVLLPCRDAARHLPACIASLEAQTVPDFEVLAIDDGSTDATRALLAEWAARDPRVSVLRGGAGLVASLRAATAEVRAPLIARMDADDESAARRFEAQLAWFEENDGAAACGSRVELFPSSEVGSGYRRYQRWLNGLSKPEAVSRDLFVECPVAHPTLMVRTTALLGVGGYRDMGWPEDYDLILRLHAAGMTIGNVPEVLLRWRVTASRLSLRSAVYSPAAFRRCKVHFLRSGVMPRDRPLVVWGAGKVGKPFARELVAQGVQPVAFVDLDPRKIGQEIHGARVLDPDGLAGIRGAYVLGAVGSPGAREEIRSALKGLGKVELEDYRMVA